MRRVVFDKHVHLNFAGSSLRVRGIVQFAMWEWGKHTIRKWHGRIWVFFSLNTRTVYELRHVRHTISPPSAEPPTGPDGHLSILISIIMLFLFSIFTQGTNVHYSPTSCFTPRCRCIFSLSQSDYELLTQILKYRNLAWVTLWLFSWHAAILRGQGRRNLLQVTIHI